LLYPVVLVPLRITTYNQSTMAKMDLPPEFVFEHKGKEPPTQTLASDTSSASEVEPDDAARGDKSPSDPEKSLKRKHNKVVTFANEPDLPNQEYSDEEEDEDEQQRCMCPHHFHSTLLFFF
jgi:hypothetical protein